MQYSDNRYKKVKVTKGGVSEDEIKQALIGIGWRDPDGVLAECKKHIEPNIEVLAKRYMITREEALLIATYTHNGDNSEAPYAKLNKLLRDDVDAFQKKSEKSYLRLLLRTLRKLSRTKPQTLYRGLNSYHDYKEGGDDTWKGFSSASKIMNPTQIFMDRSLYKKEGTLLEIRDMWGYDIADFSKYPNEQGIK